MANKYSNLAVLESKWVKRRNYSVKPVFDLLCHVTLGSSDRFHYETINSNISARDAIQRISVDSMHTCIYFATHGSKGKIHLYNKSDIIEINEISDIIRDTKSHSERNISGVYFGSCSTINDANAKLFLNSNNSLNWIAGYQKNVDWIDSTVLDTLFFQYLFNNKLNMTYELSMVKKAADLLKDRCKGLIKELRFSIYVKNSSNQIVNLML